MKNRLSGLVAGTSEEALTVAEVDPYERGRKPNEDIVEERGSSTWR